ncbi:hypothetical protein GQ53DRAFT_15157 [Thozetella sp. PMI_491]|nr:hypothetical protein GQ53DRAFT_15157 [Thozetella sp. PMI_491]
METRRILALGSTGLGGICLLRELMYRKHPTIAYVRNSSKIPEDISSNPLLEIVVGEMEDTAKLTTVVAKSSMVISLLGPTDMRNHPPYGAWYSEVLRLMREQGVRRVWGVCAGSALQPGDSFPLLASLLVRFARLVYPELNASARAIEQAFERGGQGLEWTVCRVGRMTGECDELSWKKDRMMDVYVGSVGGKGWTIETRRATLAKWIVDCIEDDQNTWVGKMPAVSA